MFETCIELGPIEKGALILIGIAVWVPFAVGMLIMLALLQIRDVIEQCQQKLNK